MVDTNYGCIRRENQSLVASNLSPCLNFSLLWSRIIHLYITRSPSFISVLTFPHFPPFHSEFKRWVSEFTVRFSIASLNKLHHVAVLKPDKIDKIHCSLFSPLLRVTNNPTMHRWIQECIRDPSEFSQHQRVEGGAGCCPEATEQCRAQHQTGPEWRYGEDGIHGNAYLKEHFRHDDRLFKRTVPRPTKLSRPHDLLCKQS